MRRKLIAAAILFILAGLVWFKLVMIPRVTFNELYHNVMLDLGLETGAERR